MRRILTAAVAAGFSVLGATSSFANPINTADTIANPSLAYGDIDANWSGYDITQGAAVNAYAVTGYTCCWVNSTPSAGWISPAEVGGVADNYPSDVNDYISWSQTFSLSSNGAASDILGELGVDNALVGIIVNGITVLGSSTPVGLGVAGFGFASLADFDIPYTDLQVGSNTIEFLTVNYASEDGNPTGLFVDFTSVPEPASAALLIIGMSIVGVASRRRRP